MGDSSEETVNADDPLLADASRALAEVNAARAAATDAADAAKEHAANIEDMQRQLVTIIADAQAKLSDISNVATQATAAKTQITDSQAVIATKSDHIQKAQEHADKVRGDLDRALTAANQVATAIEGENSRTQTAANGAAELLTNIRTIKGASETDAEAIAEALETIKQSSAQTKSLADKAATVEERIAAYEERLAELDTQCADQLKQIESLLPGATSAGLAHSFDERRQTFLKPTKKWEWLFIGSLGALIVIAAQGILHDFFSATPFTYDDLLRLWLARFPVVAALVWLALHASREAALAKRLEEDYGYKSAIASTFLGFYKQMSEVGAAADTNQPLAKLCSDTLTTVATPPGRIYEKHQLTTSPAGEITDAAKKLADICTPLTKNKGGS